jgi:hypothetical protein
MGFSKASFSDVGLSDIPFRGTEGILKGRRKGGEEKSKQERKKERKKNAKEWTDEKHA